MFNVYSSMLLQICMDYSGIPDPRTLTASEIRFFYNGLRGDLRKRKESKASPGSVQFRRYRN